MTHETTSGCGAPPQSIGGNARDSASRRPAPSIDATVGTEPLAYDTGGTAHCGPASSKKPCGPDDGPGVLMSWATSRRALAASSSSSLASRGMTTSDWTCATWPSSTRTHARVATSQTRIVPSSEPLKTSLTRAVMLASDEVELTIGSASVPSTSAPRVES